MDNHNQTILNSILTNVANNITASPTPYHVTNTVASSLKNIGYSDLKMADYFPKEPGKFYIKIGGTIFAWHRGNPKTKEFRLINAHTDSPNLRIRPQPDIEESSQLAVEIYGSPILNSWFDRDLSIAGRVGVLNQAGDSAEQLLVDFKNPFLRIPQLAIHLDKEQIGLKNLNYQEAIKPIWFKQDTNKNFKETLANHLGVKPKAILSWDLMLYDTQPSKIIHSPDGGYLSSARIDNQLSVFAALEAIKSIEEQPDTDTVRMIAFYDHEEIGSQSATGANSELTRQILERISLSSGNSTEEYNQAISNSLIVSADGAHATNPNYLTKHEPNHQIYLNKGVVIKHNSEQRYATDSISESKFKQILFNSPISFQDYSHRNDIPCGSTIGPINAAQTTIPTIDIGVSQLAMHSIREIAGCADIEDLVKIFKRVLA